MKAKGMSLKEIRDLERRSVILKNPMTETTETKTEEEIDDSKDAQRVKKLALSQAESITQEAHRVINGEKREAYGSAQDSFNKIALGWSIILNAPVTSKRVALCMIWLKCMRENNKSKRDNWVDIAGYADLGDQIK